MRYHFSSSFRIQKISKYEQFDCISIPIIFPTSISYFILMHNKIYEFMLTSKTSP